MGIRCRRCSSGGNLPADSETNTCETKTKMRTLILLFSFLTSLAFGTAAAQSLPRFGAPERHVEAELVAATDAIVAGKPLTVGLRLKHQHEWHTYWQVPGDSG